MRKTIGGEWRFRLKRFGFAPQGTGGRHGTNTARTVGPITHAVGVLVDDDHRAGAFNIQLNVNMLFPINRPPHYVVLLLADVSRDKIRIQEPWVHDPDNTTWWPPQEMELAWQTFVGTALPWFDDIARPASLIDYFEREYYRLEEEWQKVSNPSALTQMFRRIGLASKPVVNGHFQYLLWLSMLHEVEGRFDDAVNILNDYIISAEERGLKSELPKLRNYRDRLMQVARG